MTATRLFGFQAEETVSLSPSEIVAVTEGERALSDISAEGLSPCNHEADSRFFAHALHAAAEQMKSLSIKACGADVLVVAGNAFATLRGES